MAQEEFPKHSHVDGVLTRAKPERARQALASLAPDLYADESIAVLAECIRFREPKCHWLAVTTRPRLLLLHTAAGVTFTAGQDTGGLRAAGPRGGLTAGIDGSSVRLTLSTDDHRAVLQAWHSNLDANARGGAHREWKAASDTPSVSSPDEGDSGKANPVNDALLPGDTSEPAEPPRGRHAPATGPLETAPNSPGRGPGVLILALVVLTVVMGYMALYDFSDERFRTSVEVAGQVVSIECVGDTPVGSTRNLGHSACRDELRSRESMRGIYGMLALAAGVGAVAKWSRSRREN